MLSSCVKWVRTHLLGLLWEKNSNTLTKCFLDRRYSIKVSPWWFPHWNSSITAAISSYLCLPKPAYPLFVFVLQVLGHLQMELIFHLSALSTYFICLICFYRRPTLENVLLGSSSSTSPFLWQKELRFSQISQPSN